MQVRLAFAATAFALGLWAGPLRAAQDVPPPSQWQWPAVASDAALQRSIIEGGYSPEELRNIHEELQILSNVTAQRAARPAAGASEAGARPAGGGAGGATAGPGAAGGRPMPPYMTPDAVIRGRLLEGLEIVYGERGYGPEALADRMNRIESLIAKGDRLWMVWQVSGRHAGTLFGFPATDKVLQFKAYVMLRFRDGKIAEIDTHSDDLAVFRQLGGTLNFPGRVR